MGRTRATWVLLIAWALAWIGAAALLHPIEDEAYYWTWSRALAATYFDHPPGIAWVMAASTALLGDGVLGLRAPSALAVLATLLCTADTARRLTGDPGVRDLAVVIVLGAPMFAVGYVPGTHDALLGGVMALSAWLVVRALEDPRWAPLPAVVLTGAVLIKHSAGLVALGVLLGLLCTPLGRARLARPATWAGVAVGGAALTRWLLAEQAAGGGSIVFQATHVFDYAPARVWSGVPLALGSMVLTLGPVAGLGLWWASAAGLRGRVDARSTGVAVAACAALAGGALALLLACVLAVVMGSGEANWPMPALALAAPLVAVWITARPRLHRVARPLALAAGWIGVALLVHAAVPWIPLRASRDPTLRGAGVDAVAAEVERVARAYGATLLVTRRYQPASLLRYHLRDRWPVLELGNPRRQSQYDRWARPSACAGDVVVWASTEPGPPPDLAAEPLTPNDRVQRRMRPGRGGIDVWSVQVLRLTADRGEGCPR